MSVIKTYRLMFIIDHQSQINLQHRITKYYTYIVFSLLYVVDHPKENCNLARNTQTSVFPSLSRAIRTLSCCRKPKTNRPIENTVIIPAKRMTLNATGVYFPVDKSKE